MTFDYLIEYADYSIDYVDFLIIQCDLVDIFLDYSIEYDPLPRRQLGGAGEVYVVAARSEVLPTLNPQLSTINHEP